MILQVILPEIHKTFELPPSASSEAREKQAEVQGQLCGVLQVSGELSAHHLPLASCALRLPHSLGRHNSRLCQGLHHHYALTAASHCSSI